MVDATRDSIFECNDIELVKLPVPFWKDKDGNTLEVYVKQMSGKDAEDYTEATDEKHGGLKQRNVKAIICSVCNKNGEKLFNKNDVENLQKKNSRVISWLVEEILKINFKSAEELEEDAKNS